MTLALTPNLYHNLDPSPDLYPLGLWEGVKDGGSRLGVKVRVKIRVMIGVKDEGGVKVGVKIRFKVGGQG